MAILLIAIFRSTSDNGLKQHCYSMKQPHKWVRKGEDPNSYLVCETCKMLPGGQTEEGE